MVGSDRITPEQAQRAADAFAAQGFKNKLGAAVALGLAETTFRRHLVRAAKLGLLPLKPVMPGFVISETSEKQDAEGNTQHRFIRQVREAPEVKFEMPAAHVIKGVSAFVDPNNNIIGQWIKTREDDGLVDWVKVFGEAFKDYEGRAEPIIPAAYTEQDFLNLFPANDWHVNLLAWNREVDENWDLKIAERVIGNAMECCVSRTRGAEIGIVLGGGDLMHNDDNTNRTAKSHNVLDADGRHTKGLEATLRLMVKMIDTVLRTHKQVIVRILKGNHDEQSSVAIAYFLLAWYRNEPRVTVDVDQSLFWFFEFGSVMLGATHGHTIKLKDLPGIMAHRRAEMWGRTKHRYGHGFHVHHREKLADEIGGVFCETHQAPIPADGWHYGCGYLSGRSIKSVTYHKQLGEWTTQREPIQDGIGNDKSFKAREAA